MHIRPYAPIFLFLLAAMSSATAQQVPFLNQYAWNPRLFNPAAQGADGEGQVTAVYRTQFQNLDAAIRPNTYLLHADLSPLVRERIGIAAQILGDKTHLLSRFQFSGFFGYHLVKTPTLRFSLGAAAGVRTQQLDFTGRRVADVLDLSTFQDDISSTHFDGGPGMSFEYRLRNGSALALDAAATQVFSNDVRIPGTGNDTEAAAYRLVPHLLVNARYRYQGDGFALEPTVAYRAITGRQPLPAGLFDFNLNAYFLKNDLLMAGVGLRTDQGGVRFQLGVAPMPAVRLVASAEWHSALGATYEVGASYVFGKRAELALDPPIAPPIAPAPVANLVQAEHDETRMLAASIEALLVAIRDRQIAAEAVVAAGDASRDPQQQAAAADSCAALLAQSDNDLRQVRQTANAMNIKRLQAEQIVRTAASGGAPVSDETRSTLMAIGEMHAEAQGQLEALHSAQKNLLERCAAVRPQRNEASCIRAGDTDCVQELFAATLSQTVGLPDNLFPLRTFTFPGAAALTYHYPDDNESFALTPELAALALHIAAQIKQVEEQGVRLEGISLVTELQEDKNTLGYQLGLLYDGSLGNVPIAYNLVDNETAAVSNQSLALAAGSPVNLEALGMLKLAALRAFLVRQGIPAGRIVLQVRFNHSSNIYREETKAIVKFKL